MQHYKSLVEKMTESANAIYEDDESDLECELANLTELLNLYKLRLKLLQAKDKNLELVRQEREDLYDYYEMHFKDKIQEFEDDIAELSQRLFEKTRAPCFLRDAQRRKPQDDFMMDFENAVLQDWNHTWWEEPRLIPKGVNRWKDKEWASLIQKNVYPHHSDVNWHQYVTWVSEGGGDQWFQEDG